MKNIKAFDFLNEEDGTSLAKNRLTVTLVDKEDYDCVSHIFKINDVHCKMTLSTKSGARVVFDSATSQNKGLDFLDKVNIKWRKFYGIVAK